MSIRAMQAVWDHSKQDGNHLLVLLALADSANNDTYEAWLKNETLAQKARCSTRRVQEILHDLLDAGEIAVRYNAGPRRSNVYVIVLPGCGEVAATSGVVPPHGPSSGGIREKSQGAEIRRVQNSREGGRGVDNSTVFHAKPQGAETRRVRKSVEEGAETRTVGCGKPQGEGCDFAYAEGAETRGKHKRLGSRAGQVSRAVKTRRSVLDPSVDPFTYPSGNRRARARDAPSLPTRNELSAKLVQLCGYAPATGRERAAWNAALGELHEVGATVEDVEARAREYRRRYGRDIDMTPAALANNWSKLAAQGTSQGASQGASPGSSGSSSSFGSPVVRDFRASRDPLPGEMPPVPPQLAHLAERNETAAGVYVYVPGLTSREMERLSECERDVYWAYQDAYVRAVYS